MNRRNFVAVLSDIHMGTAAPSVWYRKEIHEKHLIDILNQIIANAEEIKEVILLGDLFEFWTYPPNEIPPTLEDIIATHPNILGPKGKFCQMLSALEGRVIYINGDHDMNITQEDLNKIESPEGYTIKYVCSNYIPDYDNEILFMHGHEFTLLSAPCCENGVTTLPLAYFLYRAIAYQVQNISMRRQGMTIAEMEGFGVYNLDDFLINIYDIIGKHEKSLDLVNKLIDVVVLSTGISKNSLIRINETVSVSLNDVEKMYQNIYTSWYKKKKVFQGFNGIVVTGHTHNPLITYINKKIHYVNTGFMCPCVKKMQLDQLTYGIYDVTNRTFDLVKVKENEEEHIEICENILTDGKNRIDAQEFIHMKNKADLYKCEAHKLKYTYGWSVYNESWEYFMTMQMGILSKAEELGIDIIKHDQESNTMRMITGCLDLINRGVDSLLISPYNPEAVPVIVENAKKDDIPVVVIDGGTGGADVAAFIVSDSFAGGIFAGEYALILIKKYNIESKNVAIIKAESTATYALLRGQGFKSVMMEKGYTVVAEVGANGDEVQAYEVMKNILNSNKDDLAVVFCENGNMTLGAARAIDEAGRKGKIMLIGFDATPSVLEGIKNGSIQGTIAQQPYKMGQIGVEIANDIIKGIPVTFDNSIEKLILMEVFLINENGEVKLNI